MCHPSRTVRVSMLSAGGSVRTLRSPVRGLCSALIFRKSPPSVRCSAATCLRRPGPPLSGVRPLSGAGGGYGSLSDSAPVHLCEQLLVGVQQVSGLPWWLSIGVATLSVRTLITLPLAAYQLVIVSKVSWAGLHPQVTCVMSLQWFTKSPV